MKDTAEIKLTKKEIEALQISICEEILKLEENIDLLGNCIRTIDTASLIQRKRERVEDLNALFDKLYDAEQLLIKDNN